LPGFDNRIIRGLFFGNYFYGICAVAFSAETFVHLNLSAFQPVFYLLIFAATTFYYTLAYIKTETPQSATNKRALWYAHNRQIVFVSQTILALTILTVLLFFVFTHYKTILQLDTKLLFFTATFIIFGIFYYGSGTKKGLTLRTIGWLKPFVIAYTWSGLVTFVPVVYVCITNLANCAFKESLFLLFLNNLLFVATLCTMFDIKDYAMDYNKKIKTFVVKFGLRKTIYALLLPMCVSTYFSFLLVVANANLKPAFVAINSLPYLAITLVALSLQQRKSIFYYLVVIDGLMLLKALVSILSFFASEAV
jgi:4-hydroxybenzoate polyprenyltransferase